MTVPAVCESLETRQHFAASAARLDPNYLFSADALHKRLGQNFNVYQAVPASGDRTYLLAERYAEPVDPIDNNATGYLTLIAVTADGKLDASFGTGGVALTGRITRKHLGLGLLRLDKVGRLYFADDTRVLRFHSDGTTDKSFGTRGAVSYATGDGKVALCDLVATDGGVLVATTKVHKEVEYFAVQKVGRRVKTIFSATHAAPLAEERDGNYFSSGQALARDIAQFAQSPGGTVLARVESTYETYQRTEPPDSDDYPGTFTDVRVASQKVVVTRLDANGGTDLLSKRMRLHGEEPVSLGYDDSLVLSDKARLLFVRTTAEVMRLDLKRATIQRYELPPAVYANFDPSYQVLGDGNLYVRDQVLGHNFELVTGINRYSLDGTLDRSLGKSGVLTLNPSDFHPFNDRQGVGQMFLGASGRLYLLTLGQVEGVTTLALLRV